MIKVKFSKGMFILLIAFFVLFFVTGELTHRTGLIQASSGEEMGVISIYYRGLNYGDGVGRGPRVHPILKDWSGTYYELTITDDKIDIRVGSLTDLNDATQLFFSEDPKIDETFKVHKTIFSKAVKSFNDTYGETEYHLLNFSTNCIGFMDFVLIRSRIFNS